MVLSTKIKSLKWTIKGRVKMEKYDFDGRCEVVVELGDG